MFDTSFIADHRKPAPTRSRESGFSLLEMVVVMAILIIVGAMVFVNGARLVQGIRLSQTATSYANMLQQARLRAVRDDTFYSVISPVNGTNAFIDLDPNRSQIYHCGTDYCDPQMVNSQYVSPQSNSSGPGQSNLKSQFLPSGNGQNAVDTTDSPTFSPRGLPCTINGTVCNSLTQPTAFITFFQNSVTQKWAAVTVTPAARIQVWNYDGSTWNLAN